MLKKWMGHISTWNLHSLNFDFDQNAFIRIIICYKWYVFVDIVHTRKMVKYFTNIPIDTMAAMFQISYCVCVEKINQAACTKNHTTKMRFKEVRIFRERISSTYSDSAR